jgi:hypothetical protein
MYILTCIYWNGKILMKKDFKKIEIHFRSVNEIYGFRYV